MENKPKLTPAQIAAKLLDPKAYEEEQKKLAETAKKKEAEALKKKAAPAPKNKTYYDVKVECMLPATLIYKVLAEDANQAAELIKGKTPNMVQHKLVGRKELVIKVYDTGSAVMRFMKRLFG